jgi:hypothetical protein
LAKAEAFQEKLPWGSAGREVRNSPEHLSGSEMASLQKQKQSSDAWEAAKPKLDPESVQIIDIVSKNKKASPEAIERLKGMAMSGMSPDEIKMASYRKILPRSYYKKPEYQGIQAASEAQDAAQYESKIKNWQRENVLQFPKDKSVNAPNKLQPGLAPEGSIDLEKVRDDKFFSKYVKNPATMSKGDDIDEIISGSKKPPVIESFDAADRNRVGIHLTDPTQDQIFEAAQRAQDDNFPAVFVHRTKKNKPEGKLLEFPKDRMGPVQDRSSIPFDANFRAEGENIVKFPNKQEDYERLMKASAKEVSKETIKEPALERIMARYNPMDAKRILAEIQKAPETSPYAYLGGDIHNITYAPKGATWKGGDFGDKIQTGGIPAFPKGTTPDKLPTNELGQRVLGQGVELGTNDPLMWMDRKYGVTKKLLEDAFDTPMVIKTRSDLVAMDEYLEKLNPSKHQVEIHAMTPNEHVGRIIEPGAPSFKRRIEAIQRLKEAGVPVKLKMDVLQPLEGRLPPSLQNAKSEWAEYLSTFPELQSIIEPNYIKLDKAALDRLRRELKE